MKLPSGMTTAQLRAQIESEIACGAQGRSIDILALLVAMDLRERLDKDVEMCAKFAKGFVMSAEALRDAADRVLAHEPKPDLSGASS